MTPATETWRSIPGWEGLYEVSNLGRVRSVDRTVVTGLGPRRYKGRLRRVYTGDDLRPRVTFRGAYNYKVCALVLKAFVGPRPHGMEACHNNGDSTDNRLENLRWDTPSANNYDLVLHGRHIHARKTHCKRGHLLAEPNLKASQTGRACLACARAKDACRWRPNAGADMQTVSDAYYHRIMLPARQETACSTA